MTFYENFYPLISTDGDFEGSKLAGAPVIQTSDAIEQLASPSADTSVQDDHGKHYNYCTVNWRLTRGLRIW